LTRTSSIVMMMVVAVYTTVMVMVMGRANHCNHRRKQDKQNEEACRSHGCTHLSIAPTHVPFYTNEQT
ncbi:hypothetical protein PFISCL1PPCAC_2689, partial [Pristionchus fissidentatus]